MSNKIPDPLLKRIQELKAENAELVELLLAARELIGHGDFREGYCMCGEPVEAHGFSENHAAIDAGAYYAGQFMEHIDAALAKNRDE